MSIRLITGLPGAGKTLLLMRELRDDAKAAARPLYQCGIDGIAPGFAQTLVDAREWNAIDPTKEGTCTCGNPPREPHAHSIPDGSKIYVDEAWKWFGHLHDASRQSTPRSVLELAEHRHRGIDFVWTGQAPAQFYPFARALIDHHSHVVRIFGTHNAKVYTWGELNEEVKSRARRDDGESSTMHYDRSLFDMYQSASLHTMKRRFPFRMFVIPLAVIAASVAIWMAYQSLKPKHGDALHPAAAATTRAGADALASAPLASTQGDSKHVLTADEYFKAHTPRFAAKPWSAPVYDQRPITTDPMLLCMISGTGKGSSCHCYTEQATPYPETLTDEQCRLFAKQGVYDPYRALQPPSTPMAQEGADKRPQSAQDVPQGPAGASGGIGFGRIATYGQMHTEKPAGDPDYKADHF